MPHALGRVVTSKLLCITIVMSFAGCSEPVREDRTVEFSRDGGTVAFQHDREGIYVANAQDGGVTQIFQPDKNVLATSRPLASPTDGRLIFATAEPLEEDPPAPRAAEPLEADGKIAWQRPVRFTCWLRTAEQPDQPAAVSKLFTARCEHVGYISGGLAVRWHPDGQSLFYISSLDTDRRLHSVFQFDLATQKSQRVFPHAGNAILFDWTPAGNFLTCLVSNIPQADAVNSVPDGNRGTWIGKPADDHSWWRVPGSELAAEGELKSVIEMLRASRPAWRRDDSQFAFVARKAAAAGQEEAPHLLQRVVTATREITTLAETAGRVTDLYWSPDGQRLGFVQHDSPNAATFKMVEPTGQIVDRVTSAPLRRFAGFDSTGKQVAYITPSRPDLPSDSTAWTTLLVADPGARDSVNVAAADGTGKPVEVFSGMRVTFPLWSPKEERLSLWLTFSPRYRSIFSLFLQWGLWPGDPAATIDVATGKVTWMAVTPHEELQVGHYFLLKQDAAEAWKWYSAARAQMPPAKAPANWNEFTQQLGSPGNSQVFEAICLQRLGRPEEAAARMTEFEAMFFPPPPAPPANGPPAPPASDLFGLAGLELDLLKALLHDLYVAEVFLSVDAREEALAYFKQPLDAVGKDSETLSRALVTSQLLLLARDYDGYFTHATNVVLPQTLALWTRQADEQKSAASPMLLQTAAGLSLAPLFRQDFMKLVSNDCREQQLPRWSQAAEKYASGPPAVAIDLCRRAAALASGNAAEVKAAEQRLSQNPASQQVFSGQPIDAAVASWFRFSQEGRVR